MEPKTHTAIFSDETHEVRDYFASIFNLVLIITL